MFGLSNFIITEFLLIFYSLVTNVLYSYTILLLGKEEIINDFDKMMNLFFYTMPHIIRDKNNKSFIKYGPMTIEIGRSLAGPANSVHIYIDDSED